MSIEIAQKILNRKGPMCDPNGNPDKELVLWACSQAIMYTGKGDWESSLLILGGLLRQFRSNNQGQVWEDAEAIEAIKSLMGSTFYGAGGTCGSIYWLLEGRK